jgi:hypothetical protein
MSFPYKNPISPSQLSGQQSLDRTKTFGTSYSTLSTGGYMEVYSLDQLYYTIPSSTYGPIEYSGNSIPITFSKGSGTTFSFDTLTLQPDNISSGRRKLGMLVYVYEENQIYQFLIDNYDTLWNAATGSTGTTIINDFGTTIKANSAQNISFINSWTANTIDGVSGQTYSTAVWKKYTPFSGNTSATCITDLYVENLYGCSPINVNDLLIGNSGITSDNITGLTIVNNYIETTGNTVVIDLVGSKLNDSSGNQSINLTARRQYDSNSVVTADWETKSLNDSTGVGSVSWETRGLFDSAGLTSQLWTDRRLYDVNEIKSLDYNSRGLENSSSVEVLNWETGTITNFTNIESTTISGNTITLSSSASTISLDNPSQQQIKFFDAGVGAPTYNTYSPGTKIILQDNISSIGVGCAIGIDTGILWYATDLPGNGHEWYAGEKKLVRLLPSTGFQLLGLGSPTSAAMSISGTSSIGSKGGLGYMDFLRVNNNFPSATNPDKWFRTTSGGTLQILRSDYNATIFDLQDNGILSVGGGNVATTTSNDGTSNYLLFNNNSFQIYDDGNPHIHSRSNGASMWINTNNGQLNLLTQSPTSTGGIGTGIAIATTTLNGYVTINTGRTITTAVAYGYLTTGGAGTYPGGSQSVTISLYANNRIWGQEIDAFSDERMKDIQGEVSLEEGLKLINNLKPIKYTWKDGDDKGLKVGYSAQQVIKSGFDHLVSLIPKEGLEETIDEDGFLSPKDTQFSMNYDQVTPYHGVVIKHLLDEIENLKKEIEILKNK